jgi:hypothetical protein
MERGPLSLMSTIEELLGRKGSGSSLENENTGVGIRRADYATPSILKSSPTSDSRSVGIVPSWTQATEFYYVERLQKRILEDSF